MLGMECSGSWWRAQRTAWRLSYLDEVLVKTTNIGGRFSKTWSQRIRINGRETNLGLGSYPAVTLAEARRRALRNRQSVEEGHNPRSGRTPTFQQAAAKVIELHSGNGDREAGAEESGNRACKPMCSPTSDANRSTRSPAKTS